MTQMPHEITVHYKTSADVALILDGSLRQKDDKINVLQEGAESALSRIKGIATKLLQRYTIDDRHSEEIELLDEIFEIIEEFLYS